MNINWDVLRVNLHSFVQRVGKYLILAWCKGKHISLSIARLNFRVADFKVNLLPTTDVRIILFYSQ